MEIISELHNLKTARKCGVTVGTFDGLHLGHQKIIEKLISVARSRKLCSTLVTFDPHPKIVLKQKDNFNIEILTSLDEKLDILSRSGLDRVVIVKFDREFASQTYEQFVKNILIDRIGAEAIIVGYDHAFGKDREGNFENLKILSAKYGFYLEKVGPVEFDNEVISSTLIRQAISAGDVESAAKYLGRNYSLSGKVVPGDSRGKELNYPTANIAISNSNKLIPATGVYAVDVIYEEQLYKGMLNIGFRPTFGDFNESIVEVNIFEFEKDIYDEKLTVLFKKRLRDEVKFDSVEELISQLEIDKQESLKL
jgi:riboflavin kinase / FMN adenylyltransferase